MSELGMEDGVLDWHVDEVVSGGGYCFELMFGVWRVNTAWNILRSALLVEWCLIASGARLEIGRAKADSRGPT
jgi:hypothetical protein